MRTTIQLPDDLLEDAKRLAAETRRTLTSVIVDALRAALRSKSSGRTAEPFRLSTYGRGGTLAGIDLNDSASLTER